MRILQLHRRPSYLAIFLTLTLTLVMVAGIGVSKTTQQASLQEGRHPVDQALGVPTQPEIDSVVSAGTELQLHWRPSADDDTPASEISYRVYFSEAGAGGELGDFRLAGEVTGGTHFSFDSLLPHTSFYLMVIAVDSAGNESPHSESIGIETGSRSLLLKPNRTVVDLRGTWLDLHLELPHSLRISTDAVAPEIEPGQVLIIADRNSEYILRVLSTAVEAGITYLSIEEISPFELIDKGDSRFKSGFSYGGGQQHANDLSM